MLQCISSYWSLKCFSSSILKSVKIASHIEIVDIIFAVAVQGFEGDQISWLQLAAHVFEKLVIEPYQEPDFREYKNYGKYIQLLLDCMTPSTPELLAEALMEFIYCLVKFSHQDL